MASYFVDKINSLLHNTMMLANVFFVLLLLLSYLSAHISPRELWFISFFGLAYPFFLVVNAGFVLYWLLKGKSLFLYSFITVLLGLNHLTNTFQVRLSSGQPSVTDNAFTFLSYNVRLFNLYKWIDDPGVKTSIYEFLLSDNSDIICLQEYFYNSRDSYNRTRNFRRLHERYSHIAYSSSNQRDFNFGIATFSRYPIVNTGSIEFANSSNISIYSDIVINRDTIRVFNNHLQSVQFSPDNLNFLDSLNFQDHRKNISRIIDIGRRLRQAYIQRSKQVEIIVDHIKSSPYPVIITGDFNDTPVSFTYRSLRSENLKDAFVTSGRGIGNTWVGRIPLFRIDYILYSKDLESFYFDSPKIILSDHYPLKCEFSFKREQVTP